MVSDTHDFASAALARTVRLHALGWLVAANAIGVLMAALLLWPALGDLLVPLSYGRWMALHLDWQLYGWCSVPIIGVLVQWCLDPRHPQAVVHARVVLAVWSLALALGGIAWLSGQTSGKPFLDWHGWTRPLLPIAMIVLWTVLAAHAWWRRSRDPRGVRVVRIGLLVALVVVPGLFYWASGREVYPTVNPASGGATGAALLGSTLGIVAIYGLMPLMLRVPARVSNRRIALFWAAFAVSTGVYGAIDRGNASHHAVGQIVGLGLLLAWIPLLIVFLRSYAWSDGAKRWLWAGLVWWLLLVITGWLTFLPGLSERLKFTNGLVAHAHLAMAGLVTCMNGLMLTELDPARPLRRGFWVWQVACAVHLAALWSVGWFEAEAGGDLFLSAPWTQALYLVRLGAGAVMTLASVAWWVEARGSQVITVSTEAGEPEFVSP